jgi:hypothetical protein
LTLQVKPNRPATIFSFSTANGPVSHSNLCFPAAFTKFKFKCQQPPTIYHNPCSHQSTSIPNLPSSSIQNPASPHLQLSHHQINNQTCNQSTPCPINLLYPICPNTTKPSPCLALTQTPQQLPPSIKFNPNREQDPKSNFTITITKQNHSFITKLITIPPP